MISRRVLGGTGALARAALRPGPAPGPGPCRCQCRRASTSSTSSTASLLPATYSRRDEWYSSLGGYVRKVNMEELYQRLESALPREYPMDRVQKTEPVVLPPDSHRLDAEVFAMAATLDGNGDGDFLEEVREVAYRLRMTAAASLVSPAMSHALVRAHLDAGPAHAEDLLRMLDDRLNYGIFLDPMTATLLLDGLISRDELAQAATAAGLLMLQEDFSHGPSAALSVLATHRYLASLRPPPPPAPEEAAKADAPPVRKKKEEEVKVRVAYLRNPHFDDHFDLRDPVLIAGKTLAMAAATPTIPADLSSECRLLGLAHYRKWPKAEIVVDEIVRRGSLRSDSLRTLRAATALPDFAAPEDSKSLSDVLRRLEDLKPIEIDSDAELVECAKAAIAADEGRNAESYSRLYAEWEEARASALRAEAARAERERIEADRKIREERLKELDRKIWFFDNEEAVDLSIEKNEEKIERSRPKFPKSVKKSKMMIEDYVPPEVKPRRSSN